MGQCWGSAQHEVQLVEVAMALVMLQGFDQEEMLRCHINTPADYVSFMVGAIGQLRTLGLTDW